MTLRLAQKTEAESVFKMYQSVIGQKYCVWNDLYPAMSEILHDIETSNLFLLDDNGTVTGACSIVPENEMDDFQCWTSGSNAKEIARIVIRPAFQGKGYARIMVSALLDILKERRCDIVRLSVVKENIPAYKTYQGLGFVTVGEKDMYGHSYYLCEKVL